MSDFSGNRRYYSGERPAVQLSEHDIELAIGEPGQGTNIATNQGAEVTPISAAAEKAEAHIKEMCFFAEQNDNFSLTPFAAIESLLKKTHFNKEDNETISQADYAAAFMTSDHAVCILIMRPKNKTYTLRKYAGTNQKLSEESLRELIKIHDENKKTLDKKIYFTRMLAFTLNEERKKLSISIRVDATATATAKTMASVIPPDGKQSERSTSSNPPSPSASQAPIAKVALTSKIPGRSPTAPQGYHIPKYTPPPQGFSIIPENPGRYTTKTPITYTAESKTNGSSSAPPAKSAPPDDLLAKFLAEEKASESKRAAKAAEAEQAAKEAEIKAIEAALKATGLSTIPPNSRPIIPREE